MQISRLFEIVYLLLDRQPLTAKELAGRFEVSERTIYRDIDVLAEAGVPVYAARGRGGGIRLMENFVLNKSVLSKEEQEQILSSLHSMNEVTAQEAAPVLQRLSSLFGSEQYDWIEIDFGSWNPQNPMNERFRLLKKAVLEKRILSFSYSAATGETLMRTVEPMKLLFRGGGWYLYAYCRLREGFRYFKLARMTAVELLDERFERRALPAPSAKGEGVYAPPPVGLEIRASGKMAFRIYEEFGREQVTKEADGSFRVRFQMPEDEWLYSYLLSYGGQIEVLGPAHIREGMKKRLSEAAGRYNT